jgi:hypothetical protein
MTPRPDFGRWWRFNCLIVGEDADMRQALLSLTPAAFLMMANASTALAQNHVTPPLNSCIKEFYDPEMYNWLTFKNNCSQALTVIFVAKDGSGASGSMDLRAGAKDSVGKMAGKAAKVGSFEFYVCPVGYIPVDENDRLIDKPRIKSRCQPKSK